MSAGGYAHSAGHEIRRILDAAVDGVRYLDRVVDEAPEEADEVEALRLQLRAVGDLARAADERATALYDRTRARA